jgi:hypothetical protein
MRAEPIHFAAGMTSIDALTLKGAARLSQDDRAQLAATIGDHLRASGLEWEASRWLIGFPQALDVQTREPNLAADLENALPTGADAKSVRRLMTELQMVLHEHPVNVRRERAGLPAANAVWLWGGGSVMGAMRGVTSSVRIFANDPFSVGLSHLLGAQPRTPQDPAQVLNETNNDGIVVLDLNEQTDVLTAWLQPLQVALTKGRLRELIVAIDEWTIELTRVSSWRFWRRDIPIERWSAT